MLIALTIGLIIGFLMCIPVGPINVWVVNTLLKHNFKSALAIAAGGSLMDFIYFIIILSGLSFVSFSSKTVLIFKIIGVLFLLVFGLKELFGKKQSFKVSEEVKKTQKSVFGFFILGVAIYSSNPTLVATMSALAAVIKSWNLFSFNTFNYLFLSVGLALGSFAWFYLLLKIVMKYQNKIPEKLFINFSRACGALILLFSVYMAFNVYKETLV
jgi:threonine/homoserine/homoserine lactone efflux protein